METLWVLFALVSAFSLATSDALTKKALPLHNEYLIAWLRLLLSLPILLLSLLFIDLPSPDDDFFRAFLSALPLEILAIILYIKALKVSPLSLTLPFLSLTPIFLTVIPYLILKSFGRGKMLAEGVIGQKQVIVPKIREHTVRPV